MNRPERKLKNLNEKLAAKSALGNKRVGKKAKRWKKNAETFAALTQPADQG